MLDCGIRVTSKPLTDEALVKVRESLRLGDAVTMVFIEHVKDPTRVLAWHGIVIEPIDAKWQKLHKKYIRFEEAGVNLIFPFPPARQHVHVLDVIIAAEKGVNYAGFAMSPLALSGSLTGSFSPLGPSQRAGDSVGPPPTPVATPVNEGEPLEGMMPSRSASNHYHSAAGGSSLYLDACATNDLAKAFHTRDYSHRNVIVWVCMPAVQVDNEILVSLDATIETFRSPAAALKYIQANVSTILAVVTSSLHNEFIIEGICGIDLCDEVKRLRQAGDVAKDPSQKVFPLIILATKTLAMKECTDFCDIFVHAHQKVEEIALREISSRIAPANVVFVNSTKTPLLPATTTAIQEQLKFRLHVFESTYRAYQFISSCPWNVAAVVTDPCRQLAKEGHLSGNELAQRMKDFRLARFRQPYLVMYGNLEPLERCCADQIISLEHGQSTADNELLAALGTAREKYDADDLRRSVRGAIIFGRGTNTALSNSFPSPFSITLEDITYTFPNVEQFFQAAKHYGHHEVFDAVRTAPTIHEALRVAWGSKVSPKEWNSIREEVMMYGLCQKFMIPQFAKLLLQTGDKDIVHCTFVDEDTFWGDGGDKCTHKGRNRLGEMLTWIRSLLQENREDHLRQRPCPLRVLTSESGSSGTRRPRVTNVFSITQDFLGKGGSGRVYKARDMFTNQVVAAKVSKVQRGTSDLHNEFQMLTTIDDDNVVKVLHAEMPTDGEAIIYMELMPGGSLESNATLARFYEPAIRLHVQQILSGLQALHRKEIVHCDLKPGNVLVSGTVSKLSDFGCSGFCHSIAANAPGTPYYMTLERLNGKKPTKADDIWAVGCIVIRLAAGYHHQPWLEGNEAKELRDAQVGFRVGMRMLEPPYHPAIPTHLSQLCKDFVLRCFTREPEKRPTARDLASDEWFLIDKPSDMESLEDYSKDIELHRVEAASVTECHTTGPASQQVSTKALTQPTQFPAE